VLKHFSASVAVTLAALACMACQSSGSTTAPTVVPVQPTTAPTRPPALGARNGVTSTPVTTSAPGPTLAANANDREVRLRLTFAPGQKRTMTSSSRMTFDSSLVPAGQKLEAVVMDIAISYQVIDVHIDGSATVKATFDKMDVRAGDSASGASDLVGVGFRMRLHQDGTYSDSHIDVDGFEVSDPGLDVDRLAETLIPFKYPAAPLRVGGTFQRDIRLALGNGLPETVARTTYTVAQIGTRDGNDVAHLKSHADIAVPAPPPQPGVTFGAGKATITGTDYASLATGWPMSGEQVMNMTLQLHSTDGRVSGTMSARSETTYTVR